MVIQKFGGTSVGSAERIKNVANLVADGETKIVVLSAMSGTTDKLVAIAGMLHRKQKQEARAAITDLRLLYIEVCNALFATDACKREVEELVNLHFNHLHTFTNDMFTSFEERSVVAQGELLSTALLHCHLREIGVESALLPALDFMRVDINHEPDYWYIKTNLERLLKGHPGQRLFITQGYICRNHFGEIDNLRRGGSDYSASIIGSVAAASEIQIWTDIDGMHNNDPRVVRKTRPIEKLTFDEAAELAYFGAKILHPSSVQPARKENIPVRLKNTLQPDKPGTLISNEPSGGPIKAVAAKDGITVIKIKSARMLMAYGFLRRVFEVFERYRIPIDMITTSEVAVSLTIDHSGPLDELLVDLREFGSVEVEEDQVIICIVGDLLQEKTGMAADIFQALDKVPVRMISYGGSKNNVSIVVDKAAKEQALEALNSGIFHLGQ